MQLHDFPLLNKFICGTIGCFPVSTLQSLWCWRFFQQLGRGPLPEMLYSLRKHHFWLCSLTGKNLVYTFFNPHEHQNWFPESKKSTYLVAKLFFLPQAKISRFLPRGTDCSGYKILEISCAWHILNFPFLYLNVKEEEWF